MLIYLVFLLVPLTMGIFYSPNKKNATWLVWVYFIPLLIFCGLRNGIGPDWSGYTFLYEKYLYLNVSDVFQTSEFGFFLLNKLSESLGFGLYGVMFVCALVFLWGVFSFAMQTANPWLAIGGVMPYLVFVISMSGIRQAIAMGFGFYILSRWRKSSILVKVLWISLAMTFHNSAAILLFFVIFAIKGQRFLKWTTATLVALFLGLGLNDTEVYTKYQSVYIEQNIVSGGAFFHVLLSAFPAAIYFWHRKKIRRTVGGNSTVDIASLMTLAALPLLLVSTTGVDRLALYFSFIQMWIYVALIQTFPGSRALLKAMICMLALLVFFVYFIFGSHADKYIPYNNVLFG
ncbi:EpsG family protein [Polaromonas sp.]|uniref:EpsG family protein n=1 Tax=Polaromonas sp. TaxID=1869339 RepID=UPI00286D3DAC|nr:EpsG family protein [Polaromonas sp.]